MSDNDNYILVPHEFYWEFIVYIFKLYGYSIIFMSFKEVLWLFGFGHVFIEFCCIVDVYSETEAATE